jgi:hypothetical protein
MATTRTPEGEFNCCPVCGADFMLEHSNPPGDACCPVCGSLVWLPRPTTIAMIPSAAVPLYVKRPARQAVPPKKSGLIAAKFRNSAFGSGAMLCVLAQVPLIQILLSQGHVPRQAIFLHLGIGLLALLLFLVAGVAEVTRWVSMGISRLQGSTHS